MNDAQINPNDLFTRPYIQIPFPLARTQILQAVSAYFDFLTLPDQIKNHIDIKISPMHRRGDIGFKHRDPDDHIYNDSKDFFHFHPVIFSRYQEFIEQNSLVSNFLQCALPIWNTTYDTVHQLLSGFEADFPGTLAKIFDSSEPHIVLRFLKYNYNNAGEHLAKPHFDSGSFTLAIAESSPGLRIGTGPEDLQIIFHQENKAIFMISSNVRKIIDCDHFSPGWHDVIQTDETQLGKSFARWAVVAFIDGHSVEALPRSETHKWSVG